MKTRTEQHAQRHRERTEQLWAEHFWKMKTDPVYRRRFERQPPVICVAYPRGGKK